MHQLEADIADTRGRIGRILLELRRRKNRITITLKRVGLALGAIIASGVAIRMLIKRRSAQ